MDTPPRSKPAPVSTDTVGADRAWRPSLGYLIIALVLATGGLSFVFFLLMSSWSTNERPENVATPAALPIAVSRTPVSAPTPAQELPVPVPILILEGDADPTRDLKSYVTRGQQPTMAEVITRLHEAGVHTGLGAFSPPGTRPPLVGLAVPENFVLPKGYVRHHQATDDGQRIEAILMFAPDHQLFDAAKQPIAMPNDRVVPPELAPPGLPLRPIVIPAPTKAVRLGT